MCDEPTATLDVALSSIQSQFPFSREEAKTLGRKHFFTGEVCIRGHVSKRFTCDGACFECKEICVAAYRARNPDKKHQWTKPISKEAKRGYTLRYKADPVCREKRRIYRKWYYEERFGEVEQKKWRQANPERIRQYVENRRALKNNAEGSFSAEDIKEIFRAQKGKCAYFSRCRTFIKSYYHVDHIVALSKGGSNFRSNLQLLCQPCNQRKHAKDPIVFAQELGFLL